MENAIRLGRGAFKKECKNMKIIVPSNLLEKLTFNGKDYFLVLENHVMLGIDGQ